MHNIDLLADINLTQARDHDREKIGHWGLLIYAVCRNVIHFETVGEISDTTAFLAVGTRNDDYFMSSIL